MEASIENLNRLIRQRDGIISEIISRKHSPKTDSQYDALEKKYNSKSFDELSLILKKLKP